MSRLTGAEVLKSVWASFGDKDELFRAEFDDDWEETNESDSEVSSGFVAHRNNFDCCFTHFDV